MGFWPAYCEEWNLFRETKYYKNRHFWLSNKKTTELEIKLKLNDEMESFAP